MLLLDISTFINRSRQPPAKIQQRLTRTIAKYTYSHSGAHYPYWRHHRNVQGFKWQVRPTAWQIQTILIKLPLLQRRELDLLHQHWRFFNNSGDYFQKEDMV